MDDSRRIELPLAGGAGGTARSRSRSRSRNTHNNKGTGKSSRRGKDTNAILQGYANGRGGRDAEQLVLEDILQELDFRFGQISQQIQQHNQTVINHIDELIRSNREDTALLIAASRDNTMALRTVIDLFQQLHIR